jgi:hypothetical protein
MNFFTNIFQKKPKIQFINAISEIVKIAPIVSSSNFKREWFKDLQKDFAIRSQQKYYGVGKHETEIAKCPGIYHILRYGWIQTTYQDIVIKTNGDKKSFTWQTPIDHQALCKGILPYNYVEYINGMENHLDQYENTLNTLIKIQSGWICHIPEGYYLYEGPIPYVNENRFTTLEGFYSKEHGQAELNTFLKWHVLNDEVVIKAGTPIAYYMLIPKKELPFECSVANEKHIKEIWNQWVQTNRKYVSNKSENKCIYSRIFK